MVLYLSPLQRHRSLRARAAPTSLCEEEHFGCRVVAGYCNLGSRHQAEKARAESASAKAGGAPGWDIRIDSQTGHHLVFPKAPPATGHLVAEETPEQRRQCNEEHNSCKRSCVRHVSSIL